MEPAEPASSSDAQRLRALFEQSPMAIGFSRDGITLDANPAYVRLFGYASAAELRGRSLLEQIAPSERERVREMIARRAHGEEAATRYQSRGLRKDGSEFPFDVTTTRVQVADGSLTIAFINDTSEREDAVEALKASEEKFRTLSSAALEGVFVHENGKIVLANEAGAAMYGFDPASMVGVSILDLTAPESRAAVIEHVQRGSDEPYEGVAVRRDGSRFIAEARGKTLSHQGRPTRVTILRDITERKRIEAEQRALAARVQKAQGFESLCVLAGGVAHDFNNILTVIANGVALAKREAERSPEAVAHLDAVVLAVERAADLCRQLLAYAGEARLVREPVDLGALVAEMSSMLEASIPKKVRLVRDLQAKLRPILGDATQLRQVVMNVVLNASEAVAAPEGTIHLSTGAGDYDAAFFAHSPAGGNPKAGEYIWLEVRDDGVGMDAATVAQMFDPFFTTKFVGRGLGMAAVLGIVRGHAGAIDVQSTPGQGTTVRVYFPAATTPLAVPKLEPAEVLRGEGLILVVDDEKNVRISTRMLLEGFGFQVLLARDGAEAVEIVRREAGRVDGVLLDLTMPKLDGIETLKAIRQLQPDLPIVLTSGYGSMRLEDLQRGTGPDEVLPKPYTAERLVAALRRVLRK